MKTYFFLTATIVGLLAFSSCSPVMYSAVGQNTPMLQKEGDAVLTVGGSLSSSDGEGTAVEGVHVQGAVAISNSIGVGGTFIHLGNEKDGGNYGEVTAGKFWKANKDNWIPEVYFGTGFGTIKNDGYNDIKFFIPFVQPSIGYTSKNFEFIGSSKIGFVNYNSSYTKKTPFIFEPALTFRIGWSNFKFQCQGALSTFQVPSDAYVEEYPDVKSFFTSNNFYANFGLFFRVQPPKKVK